MAAHIMMGLSMLPMAFGAFSAFGGGLGDCCSSMLGSPSQGALNGALAGGLTGTLFSGFNPVGTLVGAGIGAAIGALIGRHNQKHRCCQHHHHNPCHNYPPPCGGGYGGPQCGGYFPGNYGGGYGGNYGYGNAYNQGYQNGFQNGYAYGQGYQQGYQQGFAQGGCYPPYGGWNGGCPPQNQCHPPRCGTGNPGGHLRQEEKGKPIEYTTSGGWKICIDKDKTVFTSPDGKQKIEHSGDPHEYVNGKHIKDWEGKQRSVVLPDGTKVTLTATGPQGLTTNTSIYDGDQNVQINNTNNEITHRSFDPRDTRSRDAWQYDGETAGVRWNNRGGIDYNNYYTQDENFNVKSNMKDLAATENPRWYESPFRPFWTWGKQVTRDFYDDPRMLTT